MIVRHPSTLMYNVETNIKRKVSCASVHMFMSFVGRARSFDLWMAKSPRLSVEVSCGVRRRYQARRVVTMSTDRFTNLRVPCKQGQPVGAADFFFLFVLRWKIC